MMKHGLFIAMAFMLVGCATGKTSYESYLQRKGVDVQMAKSIEEQDTFQHCSGYGCQTKAEVAIGAQQWAKVEHIFEREAKSAMQERKKIALAIAVFEREVGALTDTSGDAGGSFEKMGKGQLDCVDESTNTTTYLSLLKKKELLKFHDVHAPTVRLPLFNSNVGWPHQTAVISEKGAGAYYVVDSWFHDNGEPAEVLPLADWREGWHPDRFQLAMHQEPQG